MTRTTVAYAIAVLVMSGTSAPALAQTAPFVVERPSFSTPPNVVGTGFWQIESGLGWDHDAPDDGDGTTIFTAPNTTLRLGVTRRIELRAATAGLVSVSVSDAGRRQTSAADTALGVKYQVAFQEGFGLDLAVVPMVSLPTGGAASSNNADPSVILSAARRFGGALLNGNVKWTRQSYGDTANERAQLLDWSLVLAHPLWGRWSAFWEGVASDSDLDDAATTFVGNAGLERQFGESLIVDVYGGVGLNDAAPNWRVGAGFGWRLRR